MATFVETVSPMKSRSILTMICCYTTVQSLKKWKPNDFLHTFYVVLTTMLNELCTCSYTRKHSPIYFVWLEIQVNLKTIKCHERHLHTILQDVKLMLRKFKKLQIRSIGALLFFFRKESNLVQMYRFGHNVTWRDAHCESSSEFIDLNLSMFAEDYRTFLQECQKWRVYPFGHNVELTGKYVSKPASNSTLELWQKGLKICG